MQYFFYGILLLLISSNAIAGPFDPTPTDKSVEILGLFGNIGTVLSGRADPALQAVFEIFNTSILSLSIIILGYITIVSLVNTAQEGQVMGKKWSSAWIPLKSLLGIILLLPIVSKGYSIIQAIVIWIVIQGVGLADNIWGVMLDYLAKGISVTGETRVNITDIEALENAGKHIFTQLLVQSACQQTLLNINKGRAPSGWTNLNNRNESINSDLTLNQAQNIRLYNNVTNSNPSSTSGELYLGIKNDSNYSKVCGGWRIEADSRAISRNIGSNQTNTIELYNAKVFAINSMFEVTKRIGQELTDANDAAYVNKKLYGAKTTAIDRFVKVLRGQVQVKDNPSNFIQNVVDRGKQIGWSAAGSYYFLLYRSQINFVVPSAYDQNQYVSVAPNAENYLKSDEKRYYEWVRNKAVSYDSMASYGDSPGLAPPPNSTPNLGNRAGKFGEFVDLMLKGVSEALKGIWGLFVSLVIGEVGQGKNVNEPLVSMALIGQSIMLTAEALWITVTIAALAASTLGIFAGLSFTFLSFLSIALTVVTVVMAIIGILYILGTALGVYLPMLPYLIYTTAILGWAMLVIEAIVAAPIIALGIITPAQTELGRAGSSLTILANIFLRPTLMLMGFIFAAKLLAAIMSFVNFGFFTTMSYIFNLKADLSSTGIHENSVVGATPPGFLSPIFVIMLYTGFVMAIASRVFSLIHAIPDKILRWIGGAAETVGQEVADVTQKTKQEYDKSAGEASKTMAGLGTKGMESLSAKVDADKKKKEDQSPL